jgi:hypothetical protein
MNDAYWTEGSQHGPDCHEVEAGPDGSNRLIHRADPCPPRCECLHIGADGFCRSCGVTLWRSILEHRL